MPEYYVKVAVDDLTTDVRGDVVGVIGDKNYQNYIPLKDLIRAEYVTVDIPVDEAQVTEFERDLVRVDPHKILLTSDLATEMVKAGWSKPL